MPKLPPKRQTQTPVLSPNIARRTMVQSRTTMNQPQIADVAKANNSSMMTPTTVPLEVPIATSPTRPIKEIMNNKPFRPPPPIPTRQLKTQELSPSSKLKLETQSSDSEQDPTLKTSNKQEPPSNIPKHQDFPQFDSKNPEELVITQIIAVTPSFSLNSSVCEDKSIIKRVEAKAPPPVPLYIGKKKPCYAIQNFKAEEEGDLELKIGDEVNITNIGIHI